MDGACVVDWLRVSVVQVDQVDVYNPLTVQSGLFDSLQFQLMRTVPGRRKAAATKVHLH